MKPITFLASALFLSVVLDSCNIFNPAEVVPTYVHIDSFNFKAGSTTLQGTASHKITNVLVYYNNQSVGNFDLPVTFPVIMTQPGTLTLRPGIDVEGLTGYEAPYLHYLADTSTITPNPGGGNYNYKPKTSYTSYSTFPFIHGFDSVNPFVHLDGSGTIAMVLNNPALPFEGAGCGVMVLKKGDPSDSMVCITGAGYSFAAPTAGLPYLEFNYRGSMPLQIGLHTTLTTTGEDYREYLIGFYNKNSSTTWNKVYVPLDYFTQLHVGATYDLIIRADRFAENDVDSVLIDNLKVVYQKQ